MGDVSEHWAALMSEDMTSGLGVVNMDTSYFIGGCESRLMQQPALENQRVENLLSLVRAQ